MALGKRLELEIDGHDPIVVDYSAVDLRAWEREHDQSCLVVNMSLDMLTWLGWHAAVRTNALNGATGSSYEDFDAICVGVRTISREEGETSSGPTQRSPSDDS